MNHEDVDKAIIPLLSKIESMGIELSKYFTVDGKVLLNALLSRIKVFAPNCLKCTKEIKSDNVIICSKCKNSFHPKCVGFTYVLKKKLGIALNYAIQNYLFLIFLIGYLFYLIISINSKN